MGVWLSSVAVPKAGRGCPPESAPDQTRTILHSALSVPPLDRCDHSPDHLDRTPRGGAGSGRPALRFTVHHRLLKPAEYEQVFNATGYTPAQRGERGGYQSSSGGLTVRARRNGSDLPRLGLIISKKSIRRAVDRNRVKRLVRESFRLNQARLGGLDVVVMSRAGLGEAPHPKLRAVLDKHWGVLERWKRER